jgi:hypothetical protein
MTTVKLVTTGVRPLIPTFFWDFDKTELGLIRAHARNLFHSYDIYQSSRERYHLVAPCVSYDEVQEKLKITKQVFPEENYILHCRRLRLRVTEKIDALTGAIVVDAPRLLECHCTHGHQERRVGILEQYYTKA